MSVPTPPITREEIFLNAILESVQPPYAITRIEMYLAKIAGADVEIPEPITRIEKYLAKIAGESVTIPVPKTRIEMYLAKIAGEDIEVPAPITRVEMYLAQWAAGAGYEEVTVTGVSPLVLASAVKRGIISLTQYGLCSQASTPTPSAPVDIMCNNGALQMVDDELPAGYKRLLGIHFDGDFRYVTGEALTGDDDVTMTLDNTLSSGKNVFGSYNGANTKNFSLYLYGGDASSGSYFRYGGQLKRPVYGDGKRTITFGKSGTQGFETDTDVTLDDFTTPANTYIGMLPNSSSPAYVGDIVGSILVSNRLEWIPCERETDGAIGYYEKYNGNFIAPSGSGTPISLGYDGSHYHLAVIGTDEVLSVTADGATQQAASVPMLLSVGDYADTAEIISGGVKRKVGIKVFDGTEEWIDGNNGYITETVQDQSGETYAPMCSHFRGVNTVPAKNSNTVRVYRTSGGTGRMYFAPNTTTYPTKEDFAAWLAEQYAAGTPVIVIYPLAEETTESVAPQPLSTSEGDNVVSVTANVSPIQLSAEYAKQKGA